MDPLTGFDGDEHEDFFRRHEPEEDAPSLAAFDGDAAEPPPPSREQLAHFKRFQKPVGLFLGAMALLSLAGLALSRSQPAQPSFVASAAPHARRALVAHYAAATPAAVPAVALASAPSVAPYLPVQWAAVSPAPGMCLLDPSAESAWLQVVLAESANGEGSAVRLSHAASARVRRPTATSSIGTHITVSARAVAASTRVAPGAGAMPAVAPHAVSMPAVVTPRVARTPAAVMPHVATMPSVVAPPVAASPAVALPSPVAPAPLRSVARFPDPR